MSEVIERRARPAHEEQADLTLQKAIAEGLILEDESEMTPRYRAVLTQTMLIAADLEVMTLALDHVAMLAAASIGDRIAVASALQDEMGHAQVMFRLLGDFGYDAYRRVFERDPRDFKTFSMLEWPPMDPIAMAISHVVGDRAGYMTTVDLEQNCTYGPYSRSLRKINFEEKFHVMRGEHMVRHYMTLGPEVQAKVQKSLDFYFPLGVEWFGATDEIKSRTDQIYYKIRGHSNDELRAKFLDALAPFCEEVGLKLPVHKDDSGHYVLDYEMPIMLNEETLEWDFTKVTWAQKLEQWKRGGSFKIPGLTRMQQEQWGSELW